MTDDLRYALRKVEPEIASSATYEEVSLFRYIVCDLLRLELQTLPLISELKEFVALTDEDARRSAFDRHIQRLKVCPRNM